MAMTSETDVGAAFDLVIEAVSKLHSTVKEK
jgi:hypothetical protein